jgi:hypothetical protein
VIRSLSYLRWSRAFLLDVRANGLSHFGRHLGQNKAKVGAFNGSVVHFNVRVGLTFLGRSCSTRQELYFYLFSRKEK